MHEEKSTKMRSSAGRSITIRRPALSPASRRTGEDIPRATKDATRDAEAPRTKAGAKP